MDKDELIEIIEKYLEMVSAKSYKSQAFKDGFETCLGIICDIFNLKE